MVWGAVKSAPQPSAAGGPTATPAWGPGATGIAAALEGTAGTIFKACWRHESCSLGVERITTKTRRHKEKLGSSLF